VSEVIGLECLFYSGTGERREIGRIRKVSFPAAERTEGFDPEGKKNPKGEQESGSAAGSVGFRTGNGDRVVIFPARAYPWGGRESGIERARERGQRGVEGEGPGTLTSPWGCLRGYTCCGRAKGHTETPASTRGASRWFGRRLSLGRGNAAEGS
jgi:hypothetical protein